MARTINRVIARRKGEQAFITDAATGEERNFLAAPSITTEAAYTSTNIVDFGDVDPLTDLDEIRIEAQFGMADAEVSIFNYFADEFLRYPFERLDQDKGFEILPLYRKGGTIQVSLSGNRGVLYIRSGRADFPTGGRSANPEETRAITRPPWPRIGDTGTVYGLLPFSWNDNDAYAADFATANRFILPQNSGRPLRYNTYFSVDLANQLLLNNPRLDRSIWPIPPQIENGRFAREPNDILQRKTAVIIYATKFLDKSFEWEGVRSTFQQLLSWPRFDVFERSGYFHHFDRVPEIVMQAYADFCYELFADPSRLLADEASRTGLSNLSVESLNLTFENKQNRFIVPDYIDTQLKEFYRKAFSSKASGFDIDY